MITTTAATTTIPITTKKRILPIIMKAFAFFLSLLSIENMEDNIHFSIFSNSVSFDEKRKYFFFPIQKFSLLNLILFFALRKGKEKTRFRGNKKFD